MNYTLETAIVALGAFLALLGAAFAHDSLFAAHMWVLFFTLLVSTVLLLRRVSFAPVDPAARARRKSEYFDGVVRYGVIATVFWGVVGFLVGVVVALQLAFPDLNIAPYFNFGRVRPLHTSAVIFAFGGNALIATSFYVVQRTCRARLFGGDLGWFVFWGYNLFIVMAATGYLLGITQGREYAEPEWYVDIWLTIVWVAYLITFLGTILTRKEPHIYVANWFYLSFIVTIAMLHIVGFFLTAGFLGMMYYFIPKQVNRPVYSYRLSIIHFWALIFMYIWAGPHHLHYTALPDWAQTLGMVFSIMLWMPSWGGMINGLMTLSGAWDKIRTDPIVRMMVMAVAFYGMATFEGPMMSIKAVNSLSHYTDWTIGHVHSGALGWNGMITFGAIYYLTPKLWGRDRLYSLQLVNWHFWLATLGIVIYAAVMWVAGIQQALMWREYDSQGFLVYSFAESVAALLPYYVMRALGGLMFLSGALIMAYNVTMTILGHQREEGASKGAAPSLQPAE